MNLTHSSTESATFDLGVHRIGRITILTCIILALCVPVLVAVLFGIIPPFKALFSGVLSVSAFMIPLSIAEILSFYPILGSGGLYIAYTTGNISNLKLPCVAIALEAAEVKPSSREGEVISIIAMSGSVIVVEILLILGVILLAPLSGYLEHPLLKPAFQNIIPALFGSLGAYFILKNYKLAVIPFLLGLGICFAHLDHYLSLFVPVSVLVSILGARMMYKKGWVQS